MSSRIPLLACLLGMFLSSASFSFAGSPVSGGPVDQQRLSGKVYLTMDEALRLAFPGCKVERTTAYLSQDDQKAIRKACGGPFKDRVVYPYIATKAGKVMGTAYFDTHKVRSLRQTLMVVISPDGKIKRVEVLAFAEPRQYLPKPKWLQLFGGQALGKNLRLGGAIRPMSGATLTANATLACSKRQLALHATLEAKKPQPVTEPKKKEVSKEKAPKEKTAKGKGQKGESQKEQSKKDQAKGVTQKKTQEKAQGKTQGKTQRENAPIAKPAAKETAAHELAEQNSKRTLVVGRS